MVGAFVEKVGSQGMMIRLPLVCHKPMLVTHKNIYEYINHMAEKILIKDSPRTWHIVFFNGSQTHLKILHVTISSTNLYVEWRK